MSERIRALVLEDERPARNYLVQLLHETERVAVLAAVSDAAQASAVLLEEPSLEVEVAFVDVRLAGQGRGGLDWMHSLAGRPSAPRFVLTTASSEHALEGYQLGAVDYLVKPFTTERVEQCVRRLLGSRPSRAASPEPARIVARDGRRLVFLALEEVLAFESEARLSFVHTERGRFDLDLSLTAIESALAGRPLLRVHRSWIVNVDAVRGLDRGDGEMLISLGRGARTLEVPVARERATEVRERLIERAVGLRR